MNAEISNGEGLLDNKDSVLLKVFSYIAIFLLLGVILTVYFLGIVPIKGPSMENTIFDAQYCLVQRRAFSIGYGDIVTIDVKDIKHISADEDGSTIIKRVVGLPGDRLVFMRAKDNDTMDLYRQNFGSDRFEKVEEPYLKEKMLYSAVVNNKDNIIPYSENITDPDIFSENDPFGLTIYANSVIIIPDNSFYFLGDNRNISVDGRRYGPLSLDLITTKYLLTLY